MAGERNNLLLLGVGGAEVGGGTGAGVDNLLLETGDNFLKESGSTDVLILE